ncbi:dihydrofolate reductase, partial [Schaalia hyovaginalis]
TRSPGYEAEGAALVPTMEEALAVARRVAASTGAPTIWIAGGAQVYADTMDLVDELVVTDLDLDVAALHPGEKVVRAPEIPAGIWVVDPSRSDAEWAPKSGDARWRVTTYLRR